MNPLIQIPIIKSKKDLKEYIKPLYIIEDYLKNEDKYDDLEKIIRNVLRGCFHIKSCREYPVRFKFYRRDREEYELQLRRFLYNIYLWRPFCILNDIYVLDESFILHEEDIPNVNDFINEKLILCFQDYNVEQTIINECVSNVLYNLRQISGDFSDIMNLTFSDNDFIEMMNDPEYREIMLVNIEEDMQPVEVEKILNEHQKRLIEKLKSDKKNPIGIMFRSKTGLKDKQVAEYLIAMGMKPTLTGEVMPIAILTSSLIGGLEKPSYQYIDAVGARKPLIMNAKSMGKAGYFGKKVSELSRTVSMSKEKVDCDTKHLIKYEIKTKKYLSKLNGKFYKMHPDDEDYEVLSVNDTHLIGKHIYARGAQTCSCAPNKICARCIGTIANLNWDIADGISVFESQEMTKELEQKILSGKHLLTTRSETIEFSEEFYKYFTLSVGEISLSEIGDFRDLALYVIPEEISKIEEFDDDSTYNTYINSGRFFIRNLKTKEDTEIKILKDKEIYISSEITKELRANKGIIKLKDIDPSTNIFEVIILNNELTKPLYDLMSLLDSDKKEGMDEVNIDTVSQMVLDIFVESGLSASMVSGEILLNRMIRRADNVMKRPDFSKEEMPDYYIYTITKVLENNESITVGLGFENLKRQLLNSNLDERTEPSFMDAFFKETLSTDPIKYEFPAKKQINYFVNAPK